MSGSGDLFQRGSRGRPIGINAATVDNAGAVMESDFDAQTVLAAVTDNTPAAVTVADSEFVGRPAGGNVGAMTAAQARTIIGDAQAATRGLVLAAATQSDATASHSTTAPAAPSGIDTVNRATLNTNLSTYQAAVDGHLDALGAVINALIDKLQAAGVMQ